MSSQSASAPKKTIIPLSELRLTLMFRWRETGKSHLSLFANDNDLACYLDLYEYLEGRISWQELIRRLPHMYQADGPRQMN
jgi:hypothetical protein